MTSIQSKLNYNCNIIKYLNLYSEIDLEDIGNCRLLFNSRYKCVPMVDIHNYPITSCNLNTIPFLIRTFDIVQTLNSHVYLYFK